jgi:hypothetical protein
MLTPRKLRTNTTGLSEKKNPEQKGNIMGIRNRSLYSEGKKKTSIVRCDRISAYDDAGKRVTALLPGSRVFIFDQIVSSIFRWLA